MCLGKEDIMRTVLVMMAFKKSDRERSPQSLRGKQGQAGCLLEKLRPWDEPSDSANLTNYETDCEFRRCFLGQVSCSTGLIAKQHSLGHESFYYFNR